MSIADANLMLTTLIDSLSTTRNAEDAALKDFDDIIIEIRSANLSSLKPTLRM